MKLTAQRCAAAVLLAAIALLGAQTRPGGAAEIRFSGVIPGAGVVNKSVTSMRERRYLNLVPQRTDFSCGAASVATILKYAYGKDTDEPRVLQEMFRISDKELVLRKGFSLLDIKRYAESLGMNAIGLKLPPENLDQVKIPTIVLIDLKGYRHFVVLKKVKDGKAYLADPALGNKVMTVENFVDVWNGVVLAIVADGYRKDTILAQAQEPLSVRRLLRARAPIVDAERFDFGLIPADLFLF